jgi:hypothetical protein
MGGLVWFGWCSTYESLLPLVRDDAALERRGCRGMDGEGQCAWGIGTGRAVWAAGLCGCCVGSAASD